MTSPVLSLGLRRVETSVAEEIAAFDRLGPRTRKALAGAAIKFSACEVEHIARQSGMKNPAMWINDRAIASVVAGASAALMREAAQA